MKLIRFMDAAGRILNGKLLDDRRALPLFGCPFESPNFGSYPVRVIRPVAPIYPPNIFAIGLNYRGHAAEQGLKKLPSHPLIFAKPTTALIAPGDPILLPASAPAEVDFEAELGVVIGKTCRRVAERDALDYVYGYTCANDVSARDCQKKLDKQWTRAKGFDTFCPIGPVVVTRDELDCSRAKLRAILNGRVMQEASTADLIFSVPFLVSYLSQQFTLLPGTLILTGTPEGVGFTRTPPVFLRAGDTIEIEIDGIGKLSNPVAAVDLDPSHGPSS